MRPDLTLCVSRLGTGIKRDFCLPSADADAGWKSDGERVAGAARPVLAAMAKVTVEDVDNLTSAVVVKVLDQLERGKVISDLEKWISPTLWQWVHGR